MLALRIDLVMPESRGAGRAHADYSASQAPSERKKIRG
jgi:hypothetical protein